MKISRRALTAGTTFLLAAATGHIMQNGVNVAASTEVVVAQEAAPVSHVTLPPDTKIVELSADLTQLAEGTVPDLPGLDVPALVDTRSFGTRMKTVETGRVALNVPSDDRFSAFGLECSATRLAITAEPKAMLELEIDAPCHENQAVTISHGGLSVTYQTDMNGQARAIIPAFDAEGKVTAAFSGGDTVETAAAVPDMAKFNRIAVVSTASQPIDLNIYENGAQFGQSGHLTSAHLRNTKSRRGGQMFVLGDPDVASGHVAEVYQFSSRTKSVRVEIAADSTPKTCGTSVVGRAIAVRKGQRDSRDLTLAMPACDGLGGTVALDITPETAIAVAAKSN